MSKKIIFRWVKVVIFCYSLAGIGLFYLQRSIIFHPQPVASDYVYPFEGPRTRNIYIPYDRQTKLHIMTFTGNDNAVSKGVILYFHGNRNNIGWYASYAMELSTKGYEVWVLDYPGFGKSTGELTEEKLYDYALQCYKLARTRFNPSQIIIYGKSLGTCLACQLASVRDCRYLILETPCYSLESLAARYLPVYPVSRMLHFHFPNYAYLKKVTAPVVIFQGTADGVVPYSNAARLKPLLGDRDLFITLEGGSHNDLTGFSLYRQTMDSLLGR